MLLRILQFLAGLILVLLPYWPLTENLFPPENQVDGQNFGTYLFLCTIIILVALGLVSLHKPNKTLAGWLLFAVGMASIFPLHLGPPRESVELLKLSYIEQFRYGMLILAVFLFFGGCFTAAAPRISLGIKIFIGFLILSTIINNWDNFSSFMFSAEMQKWVSEGKRAEEFFAQFNYHMLWRTMARASLYIVAIWLSIGLVRCAEIRKWQFVVLTTFNIIGISFCIMSFVISEAYYFPFMVPAIALSPSYWIGLMLLCNNPIRKSTS